MKFTLALFSLPFFFTLASSVLLSAEPGQPSPLPSRSFPDGFFVAMQAPTPPASPSGPVTPTVPAPQNQSLAAGAPPVDPTNIAALPPSTTPEMLGDLPPQPNIFQPAPGNQQNQQQGKALIPSVRGFKIADNESPRPLDRLYFSFNYFDNLNGPANQKFGFPVGNVRVWRETFGLEKTFANGNASIGLRLPLNTLSTDTSLPGLSGTNTDVGDLSVILKCILWQDHQGDLLSAGLAVTAPTGADSFAGSGFTPTFHSTALQPFIGYICNCDRWYFHGFSAVDVPTDPNDVTLMFNDLGVGYHLYRDDNGCVSSLAPTAEIHVNTPLDHRGSLRLNDPAGTSDLVDLTLGTNVEFQNRSRLGLGIVTPLTGPRPFDFEVLAQFRLRF